VYEQDLLINALNQSLAGAGAGAGAGARAANPPRDRGVISVGEPLGEPLGSFLECASSALLEGVARSR